MMTSSKLAELLAHDAQRVAEHLLPNGQLVSHEWCVGSLDGEHGKSLKVRVDGSKAGVWKDFAGDEAGDLLNLWQSVRSLNHQGAREEAAQFLGVELPTFTTPNKTYDPPLKPSALKPIAKATRALDYLRVERKLTDATIEAFKVAATDSHIVFPFIKNGENVMTKQLGIDRKNGKKDIRPTSSNQKPVLFGWQSLPEDSRSITICEGEIDAMSLWQYGVHALSVPFGAGTGGKHEWLANEFDDLLRFDQVYLCFDRDASGKAAVNDLIDRIGRERCLVVTLPKKDANECLQSGVTVDDIYQVFSEAKRQDPEELKPASDYVDDVIEMMYSDQKEQGLQLPYPQLSEFLFRPAELTIVQGINGHGKSMFTSQVTLDAIQSGYKVCVASMEFQPRRYMFRAFTQAAGLNNGKPTPDYLRSISNWLAGRMWLFSVTGNAATDRIFECMEYARCAYGVNFFVIDPLARCGIGLEDYPAQKAFVDRLCDFKNQHDVHVVLVCHPRKGASEDAPPNKLDVGGTGAITDMADNVLTVWRNKKKERANQKNDAGEYLKPAEQQNMENAPDALVRCDKQRNGDWEGQAGLSYINNCYQYAGSAKRGGYEYVNHKS